MSLTNKQKDLLALHLLRDEETIAGAMDRLDPEQDFIEGETAYRVLWRISSGYYRKYGHPIPQNFLITELSKVMETNEADEVAAAFELITFLIKEAYEPGTQFNAKAVITDVMQPLIWERRFDPMLQQMAASGGDADRLLLAQQLTAAADSGRVTSARAADVWDGDVERALDAAERARIATGCDLYDYLMRGTKPASVVGVLAFSGGGKTALAIESAVAMAMSGRHAAIFSWETPLRPDLRNRVYAAALGCPIDDFEGQWDRVTPEITARLKEVSEVLKTYLHLFDFTGGDDSVGGDGGVAEVGVVLRDLHSRGIKPELVILDWLGALVTKYMAAQNISGNLQRETLALSCTLAKGVAARFNCQVMITHQLRADASRGTSFRPSQYDASDFRMFGNLMHFVVVFTKMDGNKRCQAYTDKCRGPRRECTTRYDDNRGCFTVEDGDEWALVDAPNGSQTWQDTANH
jgi:RecA/RadA recombinase